MWPPQRGHFWAKDYNFYKLGRGSLDNKTYQIARLKALWFQTRNFFMLLHIYVYVKHMNPGVGPSLALEISFEKTC